MQRREKKGPVKPGFRWRGFRLMLLWWFTLIGGNIYAAGDSASASASVVSPAHVNVTIADFWSTFFGTEASVGRVTISIAGAGLLSGANSEDANEARYFSVLNGIRSAQLPFAERIRLLSAAGMLSGRIAVDLTMSDANVPGPVIITVAYN